MKELNKEIDITAETIDTVMEEIADRDEPLCKGYVCGIDLTFI